MYVWGGVPARHAGRGRGWAAPNIRHKRMTPDLYLLAMNSLPCVCVIRVILIMTLMSFGLMSTSASCRSRPYDVQLNVAFGVVRLYFVRVNVVRLTVVGVNVLRVLHTVGVSKE